MARILVVDDQAMIRSLVSRWLCAAGHTCLELGSAEAAYLLLKDRTEPGIDLLLSDIQLPEMDGIDLAILLMDEHPALNVLLMTGDLTPGLAARCLPVGLSYVRKPFLRAQLVMAVEEMLR